jgi:hypothetical protein
MRAIYITAPEGKNGQDGYYARNGSGHMATLPAARMTEGVWHMGKGTIIFFDKLGFGWVVDSTILKDVKLSIFREEELPSRSLIQMIENILSEKPIV